MTAAPVARLGALAALLTACGGAPPAPTPHIDAATIRIEAPEGVDRWEPSGATVRGDRLWIAHDRDGWLAAYALPLKPGVNRPVAAHAVKVNPGRIKFEGLAPDGEAGLLILETMQRSVWRCPDPAAGCPDIERVPVTDALANLEAAVPKPVRYITYEAIAHDGDRLWIGSRGYETLDETFHPWAIVADPTGRTAYDGRPWIVDGRAYGLSDLASDDAGLWMTWSHESPGSTTADVAGLIARAELGDDGMPGRPVLCHRVAGKPEGIARYGDALLVVFDQDGDRKDPTDGRRFPLRQTEDIVQILPADCPDGRPKIDEPDDDRDDDADEGAGDD